MNGHSTVGTKTSSNKFVSVKMNVINLWQLINAYPHHISQESIFSANG